MDATGARLVVPRVWLRISTWQKESTLGTRGSAENTSGEKTTRTSFVVFGRRPKTRAAKPLWRLETGNRAWTASGTQGRRNHDCSNTLCRFCRLAAQESRRQKSSFGTCRHDLVQWQGCHRGFLSVSLQELWTSYVAYSLRVGAIIRFGIQIKVPRKLCNWTVNCESNWFSWSKKRTYSCSSFVFGSTEYCGLVEPSGFLFENNVTYL